MVSVSASWRRQDATERLVGELLRAEAARSAHICVEVQMCMRCSTYVIENKTTPSGQNQRIGVRAHE